MKILSLAVAILAISACSATETTSCPPADQFIEPGSGPFVCETGSKDILHPYAIRSDGNGMLGLTGLIAA